MECPFAPVKTALPADGHVFHLVGTSNSVTFTELLESLKRKYRPKMETCGGCQRLSDLLAESPRI